jgi:hypothetical protein
MPRVKLMLEACRFQKHTCVDKEDAGVRWEHIHDKNNWDFSQFWQTYL